MEMAAAVAAEEEEEGETTPGRCWVVMSWIDRSDRSRITISRIGAKNYELDVCAQEPEYVKNFI